MSPSTLDPQCERRSTSHSSPPVSRHGDLPVQLKPALWVDEVHGSELYLPHLGKRISKQESSKPSVELKVIPSSSPSLSVLFTSPFPPMCDQHPSLYMSHWPLSFLGYSDEAELRPTLLCDTGPLPFMQAVCTPPLLRTASLVQVMSHNRRYHLNKSSQPIPTWVALVRAPNLFLLHCPPVCSALALSLSLSHSILSR